MATRQYVGDGIVVHWDSERCVHSERCTSGLPTVFDRERRPWVQLVDASPDDVAAVIDTCPSGALSYSRTDGAPNGRRGRALDEDPAASTAADDEWVPVSIGAADPGAAGPVVVTPLADGPLTIDGPIRLARPDGTVVSLRHCELCRCGQSATKPFCDGSHQRVGFSAAGAAEAAAAVTAPEALRSRR